MEKLYTALQVAEALQLNEQTVLRFIREGKIKAIKVGRSYRIKEADLKAYLDGAGKIELSPVDGQVGVKV